MIQFLTTESAGTAEMIISLLPMILILVFMFLII